MLKAFSNLQEMPHLTSDQDQGGIAFLSSLKDDEPGGSTSGYSVWRFDALSDDGREALIIDFYDNYPLSSRFYRAAATHGPVPESFPAVSFTYWADGKPALRAVNEFCARDFMSKEDNMAFSIGRSSCRFESAAYGSGFLLHIDLVTPRRCRLTAELEWLAVESNLSPGSHTAGTALNICAPRADVSGRIDLEKKRGGARKTIHFRGTGYHDRFRTSSSRPDVGLRCVSRAHFVDATAVVYHPHADVASQDPSAMMFLIRDGEMRKLEVRCESHQFTRHRYGVKYPRRLTVSSDENVRLRIKPVSVIQSGFFEVAMLSETTLMLGDGIARKNHGITTFTTHRRMRNPLLRWLSDRRVGRNGKPALF